MPKRLEKLRLENFRGATCPVEIEFDTSKTAVMIFGENGTGKSTIVDAIDFVCNGKLGSIETRSIGQSKIQHIPSIKTEPSKVKVSMVSNGNTWQVTLAERNPPEDGPFAQILRRNQILDIISAQPRDRYQAIKGFVEVPNVQKCEDTLREAKRITEEKLSFAIRAQTQAVAALERYWQDEGSEGENATKWALEQSKKNVGTLRSNIDSITKVLRAIANAINERTQLANAEKEHASAETKRKEAEENLSRLIEKVGESNASASLIQVLQDTQTYLEENQTVTACPVCRRDITGSELKTRITKSLESLRSVVDLKSKWDRAKRTAADTVVVKRCRTSLVSAMRTLSRVVEDCTIQTIADLKKNLEVFSEQLKGTTDPNIDVVQLSHEALSLIESYQDSLQADCDLAQRNISRLTAIKNYFATVQEKTKSRIELNKLFQRFSVMLDIVERHRKRYAESILLAMSSDVEAMYLKVHPDENIGGIQFYLNPEFQHSLEFDGKFEDISGIPPGAYYSESHLDTLGVCVFLALAKHFNRDNTIVVLDDVITSIDQAHMERFMKLLHDEAPNFNQLIITTHYRPWRDRYRYARGPIGNIQLIELLHWSLPRGIRHTKTKLSVEELDEYTQQEPLDRQIVSSKAGILLESLLDHLALIYECRLPRKPEPFYTLGELTDCIEKRLRQALKSQFVSQDSSSLISEIRLEPILTKISSLGGWIRNQVGCHWNISGLDISDSDVKALSNSTIELANALVCENCGQIPLRERSGSYFECQCGRKRLYPVNNPD
jgi:energy-coupling factor transporter ATP-binding protein EcfA2